MSYLKSIYQPNAFSITHEMDRNNYVKPHDQVQMLHSPCLKVSRRVEIMEHNEADTAETTSNDTK